MAGEDLSDVITQAPANMRSNLARMPVGRHSLEIGLTVTTPGPLVGRQRLTWQIGLGIILALMVAVPFLVVGLSGSASQDSLWTALRMAALEAFTLVSAGVIIGAFRPLLGRAIKGKTLQRLHVSVGVTGFSIAIAHGTMVAVFGLAGYGSRTLLAIPLSVLSVLLLLVASALARRRFRRSWRWVHRVSYGALAAILVHAFRLGTDARAGATVKIIFGIYAAAALTGLAYRLTQSLRTRRQPAQS